MTRTKKVLSTALVISALGMTAAIVTAKAPRFGRATLDGYQETPATLSTPASGSLKVTISPNEDFLTYTLSYEGFETNVLQSHFHLGRPAVTGGIMVFLCTNLAPPAGVPVPPACPLGGGTVSGTLNAANVIGPSAQGVAATEFAEVVAALRAEAAYVNVHTTRFPGGEIRGLVQFNDRYRDDRDHDGRD